MPNAKLKCNSCGDRFPRETMRRMSGVTHICKDNIECHVKYGVKAGSKLTAGREKEQRAKNRKKQQEMRPYRWHVKQAEEAARWFVRERDYGMPCHSCGKPMPLPSRGRHAGHFRSKGSAPQLRLWLFNIAIQCAKCNEHKSGNPAPFRIALIARFGLKIIEQIESMNHVPEFSREYLERYAKIFRKRARLYKRLREKREAIAA